MPVTGTQLIDAITGNGDLMGIDNCPGVPAQIGRAVYGAYQDDAGPGTTFLSPADLDLAIRFMGSRDNTAVWHFRSDNPVHHFAVLPWYTTGAASRQVFSVFMAYEGYYTLGNYVNQAGSAPAGLHGYKVWSLLDFRQMLSDLLSEDTAWQTYFGQVGAAKSDNLVYWKYKPISLSKAARNVAGYAI